MPHDRLLVVGLDAGDAHLIEQWSAEGWLPNISRMKERGTLWMDMETSAEVFHVSAWPSIFTGTPADVHGLYHAYVVEPGHQGLLRPRPDRTPVPFVWKLLSDRRLRTIVLDAFLTCPLREFNGIQIVDWGSWSWFWDPTIVPASIGREIRKRFGGYPFEDHSRVGVTPVSDFDGFRSRLLAAIRKKTEVLKWLLERDAWDCAIVVFGEAHPAGHYLWHLHDPEYLFQPATPSAGRAFLREVYVELDSAIGELTASIGDETTVMLVSGDGMGPNYSGSHLLDGVLASMGVLTTAGATESTPPVSAGGDARPRPDLVSRARNLVPQRLRMAVSDALLTRQMRERLSLRWKTAGIVWQETRAFVIENANEGYVRINLKGREPLGIVEPGAEFEQLRDEIHRTAIGMINPLTGRPAARAVYKTDDICAGPRRSHMPDIVIIWDVDAHITTDLLVEPYGRVRTKAASCQVAPFYTGNHAARAFAIATGAGIPSGVTQPGGSILDLAPTILTQFGIAVPAYMPGRVLRGWREASGSPGAPTAHPAG